MSGREFRISARQLTVVWSVIAGMMVMVFMFGFHAGRTEGREAALEAAGSEALRLPIARPVTDAANSALLAERGGAEEGEGEGEGLSAQRALARASAGSESAAFTEQGLDGAESEIDFAGTRAVEISPEASAKEPPLRVASAFTAKRADRLLGSGAQAAAGSISAPAATPKNQQVQAQSSASQAKAAEAKQPERAPEPEQAGVSQAAPPSGSVSIPVRTALKKGWYLQAAAARTKDEAERTGASFVRSGFPVLIEPAEVRGKQYYRVVMGPYAQKSSAERGIAKLRTLSGSNSQPFLKYVK